MAYVESGPSPSEQARPQAEQQSAQLAAELSAMTPNTEVEISQQDSAAETNVFAAKAKVNDLEAKYNQFVAGGRMEDAQITYNNLLFARTNYDALMESARVKVDPTGVHTNEKNLPPLGEENFVADPDKARFMAEQTDATQTELAQAGAAAANLKQRAETSGIFRRGGLRLEAEDKQAEVAQLRQQATYETVAAERSFGGEERLVGKSGLRRRLAKRPSGQTLMRLLNRRIFAIIKLLKAKKSDKARVTASPAPMPVALYRRRKSLLH
jgi:hypothetical protein